MFTENKLPLAPSLVNISVNIYAHRMTTRRYKLKQRAAQQELTRDRIVEATMALHEELGPRETTVSAIAERAGVQRLTVYRHFPDDHTLFQACTARWLERNRPPHPEQWREVEEPTARVRAALTAVYGYYRRTARMWIVSHRDEHQVEALQRPMEAFRDYLKGVRDDLLGAWSKSASQSEWLRVSIDHALEFSTWQSLHSKGLDDADAAAMVARWISGEVLKTAP